MDPHTNRAHSLSMSQQRCPMSQRARATEQRSLHLELQGLCNVVVVRVFMARTYQRYFDLPNACPLILVAMPLFLVASLLLLVVMASNLLAMASTYVTSCLHIVETTSHDGVTAGVMEPGLSTSCALHTSPIAKEEASALWKQEMDLLSASLSATRGTTVSLHDATRKRSASVGKRLCKDF